MATETADRPVWLLLAGGKLPAAEVLYWCRQGDALWSPATDRANLAVIAGGETIAGFTGKRGAK